MKRAILHCDMNNFYASVECMKNPGLKGKPVAVCGSTEERHGIVLAKNYEAKAYGIQTAEPVGKALSKCRELIIVEPHFDDYVKYSELAREIYYRYTDLVEPFGMDECWLDISGTERLFGPPVKVADEIRESVKRELGLTISVGVSFNKVFAKLGSDLKKPDAVTEIPQESFREKIWGLSLGEMIGAGRQTVNAMAKYGITTIGDFARCSPRWVEHILGKNGISLWQHANGQDYSPVTQKDFVFPAKSVGHGITTTADLVQDNEVWEIMLQLSQDIGRRLRCQKKSALTVSINIRDNKLCHRQWQTKLPVPTQSPTILADTAYRIFRENYDWKNPIRSLTVTATELVSEDIPVQSNLLDSVRFSKTEAADECIEKIRRKFGDKIITNAVLLKSLKLPATKAEVTLPGTPFRISG